MSGIVIKCSEIPPFIHYLMTNQNMMPVDLLFTEYFAALNSRGKLEFGDPGRQVNPFRVLQHNLLEHLGKESTFSNRGARHVGGCGTRLKVNSWMKQETFKQQCAIAGMSPCEGGADTFGPSVQYGYHRGSRKSLPGHIEILVGQPGRAATKFVTIRTTVNVHRKLYYLNDCNHDSTCRLPFRLRGRPGVVEQRIYQPRFSGRTLAVCCASTMTSRSKSAARQA